MHAQGWKQCLHCGISAPHLGTALNVSKTVCLSQVCIVWATDSEFILSVGIMDIFSWEFRPVPIDPQLLGGEFTTQPSGISSVSSERVLAAQVQLKQFPPSTTTLTAAALKPHSASGSAFSEKMVTIAYNVHRLPSHLNCENQLMYCLTGLLQHFQNFRHRDWFTGGSKAEISIDARYNIL